MSAKSASPREPKRSYSAALSTGAGTASSMAAMIVQRPSPESDTRPANFARSGLSRRARAARSSSHEAITLPRRQTSAMSAQVQVERVVLGVAQRRRLGIDGASMCARVGVVQDVQPLRIRGHHAVLDAVVDHLHEVAGAARAAMQVAALGGAAGRLASRRARRRLDARGESGEDRARAGERRPRLAADHQAVAPLQAPDAAARADVHVVDALRLQLGRAPDVVVVVGVAAVDHHVVAREERNQGAERRIDDGRRHHHPDERGAWRAGGRSPRATSSRSPPPRRVTSRLAAGGRTRRTDARPAAGAAPCWPPSDPVRSFRVPRSIPFPARRRPAAR